MITKEMASLIREADVKLMLDDGLYVITNLDKFAELVAAAEREACAKAIEQCAWPAWAEACDEREVFATAIRARGNK